MMLLRRGSVGASESLLLERAQKNHIRASPSSNRAPISLSSYKYINHATIARNPRELVSVTRTSHNKFIFTATELTIEPYFPADHATALVPTAKNAKVSVTRTAHSAVNLPLVLRSKLVY